MSNYLNNLVARTLNQGSVVQPRLASIFEPLPSAAENVVSSARNVGGEDFASSETLPGVSRATTLTPGVDTMRTEIEALPMHRLEKRVDSRAAERAVPTLPVDSHHFHPTVTSVADRVDQRDDVGPSFATRASTVLDRLRMELNEPNQPRVGSSSLANGKEDSSINLQSHRPTLRQLDSRAEDQVFDTPSNEDGRIRPSASQQTSTPQTSISILKPSALPVAPVRSEAFEPEIANQIQPTIKVTIGRVDVRAVFSQPAPTRSSRVEQSAAMSLSDYLKQRNEGRR